MVRGTAARDGPSCCRLLSRAADRRSDLRVRVGCEAPFLATDRPVTGRRGPYVEAAAVVAGQSAWVIADMLDRQLRAHPLHVTAAREPVLATIDAIRRAGDAWADRVSAAGQPDSSPRTAVHTPTSTDEFTTPEVAAMLDVSCRTARRYAATGRLDARLSAGVWLFDRGSVLAELDRREAV